MRITVGLCMEVHDIRWESLELITNTPVILSYVPDKDV